MTDNIVKFPSQEAREEEVRKELNETMAMLEDRGLRGFIIVAVTNGMDDSEDSRLVSYKNWLSPEDKLKLLVGMDVTKLNMLNSYNFNESDA